MTQIIQERWQVRRYVTAAVAASVNEVLLQGELGLELDTGLGKFGDGSSHYNDLLYSFLGKVNLVGIADGDSIVWDAAAGAWKTAAIGGGGGLSAYSYSAPSFSSVSSLLHFEGTNGSTVITDQVAGNVWTAHSDAAISTAWSAIGSSSLLVPANANSSISMPTNAGFDVGAGDWSIEFRYNYLGSPSTSARVFHSRGGDTYGGIDLEFTTGGSTALSLYLSSSGSGWDVAGGIALAPLSKTKPSEVLVACYKSTIYCVVNGFVTCQQAVNLGTGLYHNSADIVSIGGNASGTSRSINAYLDEFRFVKGHSVLVPNRIYADQGQFPDS